MVAQVTKLFHLKLVAEEKNMTTEPQILEELSALLDGELGEPRRAQLLAAMDSDPQLAEQFRQLQAVRDAVRSLPAHSAPPGMAQNILSRLQVQAAHAPSLRRSLRPQLAAAAVLIAATALGWALYFRQTEQPSETKSGARQVQLAKTDHQPAKPVNSPALPLPAVRFDRRAVDGLGETSGDPSASRLEDYVPSSAGNVINEVTIDTDQPAEVAQRVNSIFSQLPDNGNLKQDQLARNKLRIQSEVAITDEQKDKLMSDLKDLASEQRVPQQKENRAFAFASRGPAPAGSGDGGSASLPDRPLPKYTSETNKPISSMIATGPASPATSPASAPLFAKVTQSQSSRPAQFNNNASNNNIARQQFVVIVNSVNDIKAEMPTEATSHARENR